MYESNYVQCEKTAPEVPQKYVIANFVCAIIF